MMARATHKWAFKPGMRAGEYSTALGHLFHEHVATCSTACGHPREVICEARYS